MPITWIPIIGEGFCGKCKIIGNGQEINENDCIIKKGSFNEHGVLEGKNCTVINYSDTTNVSVRIGTYSEGKENGEINEYVFAKSAWGDFHTQPNGAISTKYRHIFSNGTWINTIETVNNKRIKGICSKQKSKFNNWTSFSVEE